MNCSPAAKPRVHCIAIFKQSDDGVKGWVMGQNVFGGIILRRWVFVFKLPWHWTLFALPLAESVLFMTQLSVSSFINLLSLALQHLSDQKSVLNQRWILNEAHLQFRIQASLLEISFCFWSFIPHWILWTCRCKLNIRFTEVSLDLNDGGIIINPTCSLCSPIWCWWCGWLLQGIRSGKSEASKWLIHEFHWCVYLCAQNQWTLAQTLCESDSI